MPWSVADVDQHKAGLTDAEKQRWVDIANSVLRRCQHRRTVPAGGCEAMAIKIANTRCKKEG